MQLEIFLILATIEIGACIVIFADLIGRFNYMQTIAELIETTINPKEVDIITVSVLNRTKTFQYDTIESTIEDVGGMVVKDYEIEYDSDEGLVYLDIYV